jgi:hypothetical protein
MGFSGFELDIELFMGLVVARLVLWDQRNGAIKREKTGKGLGNTSKFVLVFKTTSKHPEMIRTTVQNTAVRCRWLRIDDCLVSVLGLSTGR